MYVSSRRGLHKRQHRLMYFISGYASQTYHNGYIHKELPDSKNVVGWMTICMIRLGTASEQCFMCRCMSNILQRHRAFLSPFIRPSSRKIGIRLLPGNRHHSPTPRHFRMVVFSIRLRFVKIEERKEIRRGPMSL
jgi:hypothetical protein